MLTEFAFVSSLILTSRFHYSSQYEVLPAHYWFRSLGEYAGLVNSHLDPDAYSDPKNSNEKNRNRNLRDISELASKVLMKLFDIDITSSEENVSEPSQASPEFESEMTEKPPLASGSDELDKCGICNLFKDQVNDENKPSTEYPQELSLSDWEKLINPEVENQRHDENGKGYPLNNTNTNPSNPGSNEFRSPYGSLASPTNKLKEDTTEGSKNDFLINPKNLSQFNYNISFNANLEGRSNSEPHLHADVTLDLHVGKKDNP